LRKVKGIKRLARQLLSKVDIDEVPIAIRQLEVVASLMDKDRGIRNMLVSPLLTVEEVDKVLTVLGQKLKMSDKVTAYLRYIKNIGAIVALSEIIRAANALYLEIKNRMRAVVLSPVELSSDKKRQLEETLKRVTGKDTEVEYLIDTSLIGGIRVKLGSMMYDSSIQGQLWLLKDKLIKG